MFDEAIEYPWQGEQHVETVAIGGVLGLLGIFLVPILFVNGYFVRVIRRVSAGDTETPPVFDDWGELLTDGLLTLVIGFVYFLVPTAFLAVSWFAIFIPFVGVGIGGTSGGAITALGIVVVLVVTLVALVAGLAALYLLPAAVAAYAVTDEFAAAFSPSTLRTVGGVRRYLTALLVAFGINILAQIAGNVVALTIVGILLIPFITFYGNVASAYAIGVGVAETPLVAESRDAESATGQPAV